MSELAVASTAADAEAAQAMEQEDAEQAGALDAKVSAVILAAREGGDVDSARADLVVWCEERLLTHLKAQRAAVHPAAHPLVDLRLVVDGLRVDHDVITRLVGGLRTATIGVDAAAYAAALGAVVDGHLARVDKLLIPALATAPEVSLADIHHGMREILGVSATAAAPDPEATATASCSCGEHDGPGFPELDARVVPHAIRHATIFGALDSVHPGRGLILIAPHDPLPLLAQVEARDPGAFEVSYLERGPEAWRLQFFRSAG